jgi:hypothetical protein
MHGRAYIYRSIPTGQILFTKNHMMSKQVTSMLHRNNTQMIPFLVQNVRSKDMLLLMLPRLYSSEWHNIE